MTKILISKTSWALVLFIAFFALLGSQDSFALPCRADLIPNGNRFWCGNCHNPDKSRNPFGKSVEQVVKPGSCDPFWSADLARQDSDGDGITNGEELQDAAGAWTIVKDAPGDFVKVTNPGVSNRPGEEAGRQWSEIVAPFGQATISAFILTALAGFFMKKNRKLFFLWHRRLSFIALALAVVHAILASVFY